MVLLAPCGHHHCRKCVEAMVEGLLQGEGGAGESENGVDTAAVIRCKACDAMGRTEAIIGCLSPDEAHAWQRQSLRGLLDTIGIAKMTPEQEKCPLCCKSMGLHPLELISPSEAAERMEALANGPVSDLLECAAVACFAMCENCQHQYCRLCRRGCSESTAHFMNLCEAGYAALVAEILAFMQTCSGDYCSPAALKIQQRSCDVFGIGEEDSSTHEEERKRSKKEGRSGKAKSKGARKKSKDRRITRESYTLPTDDGVGFGGGHDMRDLDGALAKEDVRRKGLSYVLVVLSKVLGSTCQVLEPHPSLFPLIRTSCLLPVLGHFLRTSWLMEASMQDSALFYSILGMVRALLRNQVLYSVMEVPIRDEKASTLHHFCSEHVRQAELFLKQHKSFEANEDEAVVSLLGLALDAYDSLSVFDACAGKSLAPRERSGATVRALPEYLGHW